MADTYAPGQDPFAEQTDIPAGVDPFGPAPTAPQPTLGESAARQGKLFVRSLASAAASPLTLPGDMVNKFINGAGQLMGHDPKLQMPSQMVQNAYTSAGLPEPTTGIEKFTQGLSESAPAFALPAGWLGTVGGNAAVSSAAAQPGNEGKAALLGAGGGAFAKTLAAMARGVVTPSQAGAAMADRGVALTPGQSAGTGSVIGKIEEYLASNPVAAPFINAARSRGVNESNRAAAQSVADVVNARAKVTGNPREAIEQTHDLISKTFTDSLTGISAPVAQVESHLGQVVQSLPQRFPLIPAQDFAQMGNYVTQRVGQIGRNGVTHLDGPMLKQLDSEIGQHVRNLQNSTTAADKTAAPAWREFQSELRAALERAQGDPIKSQMLASANAAWRQLLALEKTLLPGAQTFTPRRLQTTLDKRGISGTGLNQVAQDMSATVGNTVPNSGTAERLIANGLPALLMGGGYGADQLGYPTLGMGAMAAGALGTRTGARVLTGSTAPQRLISQGIRPFEPGLAAIMAKALRGEL